MEFVVMKQYEKATVAMGVLADTCRYHGEGDWAPEGFVYVHGKMGTVGGLRNFIEDGDFDAAEKGTYMIPISSIAYIEHVQKTK